MHRYKPELDNQGIKAHTGAQDQYIKLKIKN